MLLFFSEPFPHLFENPVCLCVSDMLLSFLSQIKYKEGWEKSKGRGFEMKLDSLPLLAAKASRDLASDVCYIWLPGNYSFYKCL